MSVCVFIGVFVQTGNTMAPELHPADNRPSSALQTFRTSNDQMIPAPPTTQNNSNKQLTRVSSLSYVSVKTAISPPRGRDRGRV